MGIRPGMAFRVVIAAVAIILLSPAAAGQRNPESPVFRDNGSGRARTLPRNPDPAKQWREVELLRQANEGDAFARHELGLRYLLGDGYAPDTTKAAHWIRLAADQGLAPANYNLGLLLVNGWGVHWDPFEAFRRISFAAEHGMDEARHLLGMMYTEDLVVPRDWKRAAYWIKAAADSGYAASREVIDEITRRAGKSSEDETGDPGPAGSERSSGFAAWKPVLLDFSADSFEARQPEMNMLARTAVMTAGLSGNDSLLLLGAVSARKTNAPELALLDSALAFGNPEVVMLLARCRAEGLITPADPVLTAAEYIRAVYLYAPAALHLLWSLASPPPFQQALRRRVADGDPVAQFVQAELFALGIDRTITEYQALDLLAAAARGGLLRAVLHLGLRRQAGRWTERDPRAAAALWRTAAEAGDREAAVRLAASPALLDSASTYTTEALDLLRTADRHGSIIARVALAFCFEQGRGVPADAGAAARLYRSAAYRGSRSAFDALRNMHDRIRPPDREFDMDDTK